MRHHVSAIRPCMRSLTASVPMCAGKSARAHVSNFHGQRQARYRHLTYLPACEVPV